MKTTIDIPIEGALRADGLAPMTSAPLREWFGDIDIYLFDQLLRDRIRPEMSILDAGCAGWNPWRRYRSPPRVSTRS